MTARLFAAKQPHSTAFHKLALEISHVLGNSGLTLQICNEMDYNSSTKSYYTFHAKWVNHPLLSIVTALETNKETQKDTLHQNIISRAFDVSLSLYQEKQLSIFIMNSILQAPAKFNENHSLVPCSLINFMLIKGNNFIHPEDTKDDISILKLKLRRFLKTFLCSYQQNLHVLCNIFEALNKNWIWEKINICFILIFKWFKT